MLHSGTFTFAGYSQGSLLLLAPITLSGTITLSDTTSASVCNADCTPGWSTCTWHAGASQPLVGKNCEQICQSNWMMLQEITIHRNNTDRARAELKTQSPAWPFPCKQLVCRISRIATRLIVRLQWPPKICIVFPKHTKERLPFLENFNDALIDLPRESCAKEISLQAVLASAVPPC